MRIWRSLLRGAALGLVLVVAAACSDDASGSSSTTTAAPATRGEELAAEMGCERTETFDLAKDANNENWGFDEAIDCWLDGRKAIRIHTIDPQRVPVVVSMFRARYSDEPSLKCASGEENGQFVVAGEDWVAIATSTTIRNYVMDRLGGETVPGDGGPPVSYTMMNPCEDVTSSSGD